MSASQSDSKLFNQFLEWKAERLKESGSPTVPNQEDHGGASSSRDHREASSSGHSPSASPENKTVFTAEEYLAKRAKGGRSSQAMKKFRHILMSSCKECKLWGSGKTLRGAIPAQRKHIRDTVISELPVLKGYNLEIDSAVARALANKNHYERIKQGRKKGTKNQRSTKETGKSTSFKSSEGTSSSKGSESTITSSSKGSESTITSSQGTSSKSSKGTSSKSSEASGLAAGDNIVVIHCGEDIATGLFKSATDLGMYCVIEFSEHLYENPQEELEEINLPEPTDSGKESFWELQENDVFMWKLDKIKPNVPRGGYVIGKKKPKTSPPITGKRKIVKKTFY